MNSGDDNHGRGHPGPAGPRPAGVLARAWFWISWPFVWLWRSCRDGWLMVKGERKARRWWRPQVWPVTALYIVLSVVYIGLIVLSPARGAPSQRRWGPSTEEQWSSMLTALGLSSTTVVAAAWFLLWRFWRARRYYLRRARRHADEMVRPGTIIGEVVGRDPLCDALMDDLRDRKRRRPHVIVGAIGVGKSALLVRLTQKLAEKGVAPVVVRLRDVRGELDFARLAEDTFLAEILVKVSSRSEAEKVWHRLRRQSDRVVVLADGLEDALKDAPDRENVIREAIGKAGKDGLPLVVTSRPEKSLESIDAAQTHLGPLSEEAALHYVAEATNWRSDRQRMSWVVEAAEIAESPLYLNIAKDLERRGLLEPVVGGGGEDEYTSACTHPDADEQGRREEPCRRRAAGLPRGAVRSVRSSGGRSGRPPGRSGRREPGGRLGPGGPYEPGGAHRRPAGGELGKPPGPRGGAGPGRPVPPQRAAGLPRLPVHGRADAGQDGGRVRAAAGRHGRGVAVRGRPGGGAPHPLLRHRDGGRHRRLLHAGAAAPRS
ncbi:NACHT domain-containing protein [Streptomyces rubrolavendulae]|uniref:NACHT domain protein n=1 Tax=Streptomyces rubrolavendulae TaxID=285473 RepID=A0A1D8G871_9ACTN|nr:NACHT domain-containing protein [Streptomyces rubrolavendulae]AOT61632.1 NACHT domain protein [Streptomyces rubrolavendulae]